MLANPFKLEQLGLLGINRRNADYTLCYNERKRYPCVDDKVLTKELAGQAGIAVPERFGVVESVGQIKRLGPFLEKYSDFVLKPAHGSGGEGIIVIAGRTKSFYRKSSGRLLSEKELQFHVSDILSGLFSLGGRSDRALIEYRVKPSALFEGISYQGVPDIRIVVFLGVPVMAMIRLPTQLSDGKANLHQGAIGVGVDLTNGRTLSTGVWRNQVVMEHPDTGNPVTDIELPEWPKLLELAAKCYEVTGLGYQGVDIVLDRDKGPLLLEINARPGLNIQLANRVGLLPRLRRVERDAVELKTAAERVEFSQHTLTELK